MNTPYDAEWLEYDDDTRPVEPFERSLLRADIKAGNTEAAEAQLERIKQLEGRGAPTEGGDVT